MAYGMPRGCGRVRTETARHKLRGIIQEGGGCFGKTYIAEDKLCDYTN